MTPGAGSGACGMTREAPATLFADSACSFKGEQAWQVGKKGAKSQCRVALPGGADGWRRHDGVSLPKVPTGRLATSNRISGTWRFDRSITPTLS